jgi:hypothetical protein
MRNNCVFCLQLTVPGLFGLIGEIAVLLVATMEVVTDNVHVLPRLLNLAVVNVLETTQRLVLVRIIHDLCFAFYIKVSIPVTR